MVRRRNTTPFRNRTHKTVIMKVSQFSLITALALGGLITFAPLSRAQDSKENTSPSATNPSQSSGGQRARRSGGQQNQFDRISKELKLTDEQKTKLQPIVQEENAKLREVRQDANLSTEQKREKVRELRDQYTAKIKPVLTAEQFEQYKKIRQQGGGRGPRSSGAGTPNNNSNSNTEK